MDETELAPDEGMTLSEDEAVGLLDAAEGPGDEILEATDVAPALEAPQGWDEDARARFAELPPDLQAHALELEASREAAVGEAYERAEQAEADAALAVQFGAVLEELVPRARAMFADRWEAVDWGRLAREDVGEYWRLRAFRDEEAVELERLDAAQQISQAQAFQRFAAEREDGLRVTAPALCDPAEGGTRRAELSDYLLDHGIEADLVRQADAAMIGIAWKALQYDRAAQALARERKSGPAPGSGPRPLAPAGAPARGSMTRQRADKARARFASSRSIADAVAALDALG